MWPYFVPRLRDYVGAYADFAPQLRDPACAGDSEFWIGKSKQGEGKVRL